MVGYCNFRSNHPNASWRRVRPPPAFVGRTMCLVPQASGHECLRSRRRSFPRSTQHHPTPLLPETTPAEVVLGANGEYCAGSQHVRVRRRPVGRAHRPSSIRLHADQNCRPWDERLRSSSRELTQHVLRHASLKCAVVERSCRRGKFPDQRHIRRRV